MGKLFIVPSQTMKSIDGQDAHPVLWICNENYHHIRRAGWNRPVDFNEIYGTPDNSGDEMPGPTEPDERWEEWVWDQTQKREEEKKRKLTLRM